MKFVIIFIAIMLSIITILLYSIVTAFLTLRLFQQFRVNALLLLTLLFLSVSCHGFLLYQWIDSGIGQNLTLFNVASFITWLLALFVLFAPSKDLGLIIFPITILFILLASIFPSQHIILAGHNPAELFHILFSLLAFSVLCLAATQAILCSLQERLIRKRQGGLFLQCLAPMETMEKILFYMIALGFILLTIVLVSSVIAFEHFFLAKTLFVALAWSVFARLLWGQTITGWRGQIAFNWTLTGMGILTVAYFIVWGILRA